MHSLKDLPTEAPDGLALGAILEREDPRDALVSTGGRLEALPAGARIGTSSLRRRAQLAALRRDLDIVDLRGNVPTRVGKVTEGDLDAAVLALAGLKRLGLEHRVAEIFDPARLVPAPGQGAMAVQVRAGDAGVSRLVAPLDHGPTRLATTAERALLGFLEGGCQVPVGAFTRTDADGTLHLFGCVASLDGASVVRRDASALVRTAEDAGALGEALARDLVDAGARAILDAIRLSATAPTAAEDRG